MVTAFAYEAQGFVSGFFPNHKNNILHLFVVRCCSYSGIKMRFISVNMFCGINKNCIKSQFYNFCGFFNIKIFMLFITPVKRLIMTVRMRDFELIFGD